MGNDKCWYGATHFTPEVLRSVVEELVGWAGIEFSKVTSGTLRTARRGSLNFAFNFGNECAEIDADEGAEFFVGGKTIPAFDVAIWRA